MRMSPRSLFLYSLAVIFLSTSDMAWAQSSPEVPWSVKRNAIRATIRDYDSRLRARFEFKLSEWTREFARKRASMVDSAAKRLAARAAEIRDKKGISWTAVGKDEEFRKEMLLVIHNLLEPSQIKKQLQQWAKSVEDDTRREMVACLAQIIAWDLGMKFDKKLRGKVQAAVRSIPVEQLVGDEVNQEKIVKKIQDALPGTILTDVQKAAISSAAGELARRGAQWVARTQFQLPQDWTQFLSGLAALGGAWLGEKGSEWLDRTLTGEPDPDRLAKAMDSALYSFNEGQISGKLKKILGSYRYQVIEFVQSEGTKAYKAMELGPGP